MANQIPVRISTRKLSAKKPKLRDAYRNLTKVKIIGREPSKPRQIPKCLVLNARSLAKPDAYPSLYAELNSNCIDLCFISETWLHSAISSSLICPPGYSIFRKDRQNSRGGGVAILCRNDWRMEIIPEAENIFECIWMKIMTKNSTFSVASIYHPPSDYSYDAKDFIDYLIDSCERILLRDPNMNIIIAGDINKLNIYDLLSQQALTQMVKAPTRCNNILDVFITNVPYYWKKVQVRKGLLRSDHNIIITFPKDIIKAERTNSFFRDVRDHRKQRMFTDLDSVDWNKIMNEESSSNEMVTQFYDILWPKFETCFPLIKVRSSSRDPPFMSPLIKHLLKKRRQAMRTGDEETNTRLRNQVNRLIHSNLVNAVKNEKDGSKKWWSKVNSMTGRKGNNLPVSSVIEPSVINTYFQGINTDIEYSPPQLLSIPKATRIPSISPDMVFNLLRKLKRTASGPDDIPFWFWKTYAAILTPVITRIFNLILP